MAANAKVSNEKKNLNRLAGEFLVASRLTQRGYMVALQWGTTIGYDVLVFDKSGNSAFLEIKSSASNSRRWLLQQKYANPRADKIPANRRFVCCVDLAIKGKEPDVYVFPATVVADGLHYFFASKFPNSPSYHLSLDFKPQYRTKEDGVLTVGQHIEAETFLENYAVIGIETVTV
ncbi:hypothetical protein [Burkholderia pseudomallei]|uniref:hypothetical protein n=1 Tax=Burkholderia pseudomallei TaxID=28450 RepID=UPI000A1A0A8A|nr:hypothetical protein [Burkholderia pseudomallei]ARL57180.1 hypothetical protein BOC52_11900 [Burkholderia pseudomallei]ARL64153.1 hypothetical protein BOC53_12265 [Burkholderia pseudomallei]